MPQGPFQKAEPSNNQELEITRSRFKKDVLSSVSHNIDIQLAKHDTSTVRLAPEIIDQETPIIQPEETIAGPTSEPQHNHNHDSTTPRSSTQTRPRQRAIELPHVRTIPREQQNPSEDKPYNLKDIFKEISKIFETTLSKVSQFAKNTIESLAKSIGFNTDFLTEETPINQPNRADQSILPDIGSTEPIAGAALEQELNSIHPSLELVNRRLMTSISENGGPRPQQIVELREEIDIPLTELLKHINDICLASRLHHQPIEVMLPLCLATINRESGFNTNASHGSHVGLYQHDIEAWPGRLEDNQRELTSAGLWEREVQGRPASETIQNPTLQHFVSVNAMIRNFESISHGVAMQNYDPSTVARDTYLTHNMGRGHAWAVGYLRGDISRSEMETRFNNRDSDGRTQNGDIFRDYAFRRLIIREPEDQTWNKVQNDFNTYRSILYPPTIV